MSCLLCKLRVQHMGVFFCACSAGAGVLLTCKPRVRIHIRRSKEPATVAEWPGRL